MAVLKYKNEKDCRRYLKSHWIEDLSEKDVDAYFEGKCPAWNDMTAKEFAKAVKKNGGHGWHEVYASLKRMWE